MQDKPNIILIVADQLRYDCLGFTKRYPVHTPHLDKLAAEGVSFAKAYTPIPVCGPARTSLMSGRRAEECGCYWNNSNMRTQSLRPNTFYSWLIELINNGYITAHFGKWDINPIYTPLDFGYDKSISLAKKVSQLNDLQEINGYFGAVDYDKYENSIAYWETDRTIELIKHCNKKKEPFFVHCEFIQPHLPCFPNKQFIDIYEGKTIPKWENFDESFHNKPYIQKQQLLSWKVNTFKWEDWESVVRRYYAAVSQLDDCVGRIKQTLEEIGQADNTIIIFTADHGSLCGAHRMMDKHYVMYEDVIHVPLIIHYPTKFPAREISDFYVCNTLDLASTITDFTENYEGKYSDFHGISLLPSLLGQPQPNMRDSIEITFNGQQAGLYSQRCIRTDKWKYVWNGTDVDELYDMENDQHELNNLIYSGLDDVVAALREKLYEKLLAHDDALMMSQFIRNQFLGNLKI